MLGLAQAGQVGVDDGGGGAFVAEVDLDLPEVFALFEQVGGVGMAEGVNVGGLFHPAGDERDPKGPLQGGPAHRFGGGGGTPAGLPPGREEQRGMTMGFPLQTEEFGRPLGQGHIAVVVALAATDVEEHAAGINVADLDAQGFAQTQAAGIDEGEADAMIEGGDGGEDAADFNGGEDDGQFGLGIGADEFQLVGPGAFEGFLPEKLEGADDLGAGLAGDFLFGLEMNAILAEVLGGDQVGGFGEELAELADAGVIGLGGAGRDGEQAEIIGE